MNLKENADINRIVVSVRASMMEYMEPGESAYTAKDVEKCMKLIDGFLGDMSAADSKKKALPHIKKVVLALNDLNEACEYELIETDQREQLADIIILAGYLKGYNKRTEDTTEDWREW
ncbi:MAG: hypothetical protein NWQ09_06655 [Nonlabens sp.]|nr:hypothetical protein [Nonlabens sp.]MDP5100986.1 hypothetical protein [Nonlabens sp.]